MNSLGSGILVVDNIVFVKLVFSLICKTTDYVKMDRSFEFGQCEWLGHLLQVLVIGSNVLFVKKKVVVNKKNHRIVGGQLQSFLSHTLRWDLFTNSRNFLFVP